MDNITILTIYGGSVLLSFPFILAGCKEYSHIWNPKIIATILSLIPGVNLWLSGPLIAWWIMYKVRIWRLRRKAKTSGSTEFKNALNEIADLMEESNKINTE